jgi:riboflavin kinase
MRPDGPRPKIIGPDSGPEPPFPLRMKGKIVSGFGRGSKEVRTLPITQKAPITLELR